MYEIVCINHIPGFTIPNLNISNSYLFLIMKYFTQPKSFYLKDSPTVWPLCAVFSKLPQFYVPFYVKK